MTTLDMLTSTYGMFVLQLSQLQAELEVEWKGKCEQMLASAKEQHSRELAELTEQRDALQDKQTQLQEKVDKITHAVMKRLQSESLKHGVTIITNNVSVNV